MKKLIVLFGAIALLSSCSRYYVSTLESSNTKKKEATGEFLFENDTLSITYNFHGVNAPISIEFYNKLNEPLYVNWQKSALIEGDRATSYLGKQIPFKANLSGSSVNVFPQGNLETSSYDATIYGTATLPEEISFIPPRSRITKIPLKLAQINYKSIADTLYQKTYIDLNNREGIWAKQASFNLQNSPLNFKSYLSFYTLKGNEQQNFSLGQDFYISNLVKMGVNPKHMYIMEGNPGNIFYYSESTGYGKTMGGVGIAALIVGAAALDSSTNKKDKKTN
ncbi:lipoprotein [Pedobacter caeni]|uniref:Uncharacterized protein n=1 Tax=Pedobacter caeni TaxID=288992 RepID=A0A1M5MJL6_9SPHI|nr:lipoprotein [Pedobacter caeni]SHG77405.1 hypothetical protein SAMN04488522_107211 [Pedobacter caeni]